MGIDDVGFGLDVAVVPRNLADRFIFPPFSILRTYDGKWRARKKRWLALEIESELGRVDGLTFRGATSVDDWTGNIMEDRGGGTSIFDPVLCELMYSWFCPVAGQIVDPFAGGSVRGIVAVVMGYRYWGSELRPEQVEANRRQARSICPDNKPIWVCGDALLELKNAPMADFIFTCPPYGNLESYSDLDSDLSNMEYDEFLLAYRRIIKRACRKLKDNRFACFVVANFRDRKRGMYHNLVGDTVCAFTSCGLGFYNDIVLATSIGSLPVRVKRQFEGNRKIGKAHQNVLIFYKGDVGKIKDIQWEGACYDR